MKLFIVTGASGGFGTAILQQINKLHKNSVIVACSRKKDIIYKISSQLTDSEVRFCSTEFSENAKIRGVCEDIIKVGYGVFEEVYLINNHGLLNDSSKPLAQEGDPVDLALNMDVNFVSFQVLTSVFLNSFDGAKKTIVNISSLAAIKPISAMGLYCAGKAARLMLYKVLALENPDLSILNYSPGPMLTNMTKELKDKAFSSDTKKMFQSLSSDVSWVDCDVSAKKMFDILAEGNYQSGDQIDFYDR